jgi:uncharacterized protein YciI
MLILDLTYKVALEQADAQMTPHLAWVKQGYEQGWFLGSGRKTPRTGGVIFARGDRAAIEAYCATDPFVIHGIADYAITDVTVTTVAAGFDALKDA